jgi:hypothetical protein
VAVVAVRMAEGIEGGHWIKPKQIGRQAQLQRQLRLQLRLQLNTTG